MAQMPKKLSNMDTKLYVDKAEAAKETNKPVGWLELLRNPSLTLTAPGWVSLRSTYAPGSIDLSRLSRVVLDQPQADLGPSLAQAFRERTSRFEAGSGYPDVAATAERFADDRFADRFAVDHGFQNLTDDLPRQFVEPGGTAGVSLISM
ncbi:MAG: hypothetical protein WBD71_13125 [Xanthobacteraceae bacterium]